MKGFMEEAEVLGRFFVCIKCQHFEEQNRNGCLEICAYNS